MTWFDPKSRSWADFRALPTDMLGDIGCRIGDNVLGGVVFEYPPAGFEARSMRGGSSGNLPSMGWPEWFLIFLTNSPLSSLKKPYLFSCYF